MVRSIPAAAQTWPAKPVRIIATVAPAGGVDIVARQVAPKLTESLRQPVIVGNTPEEFSALIKRGFEVHGAVVKAAGLKPED